MKSLASIILDTHIQGPEVRGWYFFQISKGDSKPFYLNFL